VTLLAQTSNQCVERKIPKLTDVLNKTGIKFAHSSAPEKKYIVESMSGGVLIIDFDRDGWQDIYFPNAPTVEMALKNERAKSALYRNNGDGTFTEITEKSGTDYPGFPMGGPVGDLNKNGPSRGSQCVVGWPISTMKAGRLCT